MNYACLIQKKQERLYTNRFVTTGQVTPLTLPKTNN